MQPSTPSPTGSFSNGSARRKFDLARALERFGGDWELFRDMVVTFFDDTPQTLQSMQDGLAQGDFTAVARGAHRLKGTLVYYGVDSLVVALRAVEEASGTRDPAVVAEALHTVQAEIGQLCAALEPHRPAVGR